MKRLRIPIVLVGGTVLLLMQSGCPSKDASKPTILEPRAQPYVVDLPVPRDFRLNERESTHNMVAGRRNVKHLYEGSSATLLVRSFYAQNMPTYGWEATDEKLMRNIYVLRYRKGEEKCEVRIEPKYTTFGQSTLIWASIRSETYTPPGGGLEP